MSKFQEIINGDIPVLVDFHAVWCGPCKMMEPIIKEMAKEFEGKVKFLKVDVDKNPLAASYYQVQGVPTLILFHKGKILWRQAGVVPAPQLKSIIKSHLSEKV